MGIVLSFLGQLMRLPHVRAFENSRSSPMQAQERVLLDILRSNSECEYGREHGFASISSIRQYQRRVPVVGYEDIRPRVERMLKGEAKVMTDEKPHYFCCTSGTTGTPKFNPITNKYRDQFQKTVHVFLYHLFRDHPPAGRRQVLYFVGSNRLGESPGGTPYGTMSGYNYNALPSYARRLYAVPYEVFQVPDLELKYYTIVRLALLKRISFAVSITPTPLITFAKTLTANSENLIRDVADGGMKDSKKLPADVAGCLRDLMPAAPGRARQLEELAENDNFSTVTVWPDLCVLSCWIGAAAGLYVPELKGLFPGIPIRDAIYSATEGWCNIPLRDETPGGPLGVLSHFFEFIPEDEYDKDDRNVLTLDRLEKGKRYFIILTTGGGQYRYDLKDVLEVTGFYGEIPEMRFVHKGGHCFNIAGEKMTESHINEAIDRLRRTQGISIAWFVAVPRQTAGDAGYDIYIETTDSLENAAAFIEQQLRAINWEYESHRDCRDLGPVRIIRLRQGNFNRIRATLAERGGQEAQMKPPHLTDKSSIIDALERAD